MREWLANRIYAALVETVDGVERPPTSKLATRVHEPDDSDIVLVSHGDSFDLVYGDGDAYRVASMTPKAALHLAWFILWTWWFKATWAGWKMSAWHWAVSTRLDEKRHRENLERAKRKRIHQEYRKNLELPRHDGNGNLL